MVIEDMEGIDLLQSLLLSIRVKKRRCESGRVRPVDDSLQTKMHQEMSIHLQTKRMHFNESKST